jgi:L,D-transpeptidase ErfK/SrfK
MNAKKIRVIVGCFVFLTFCLFLPLKALALVFPLPQAGDSIVGTPQTAEVKPGEDFSDIALRYTVGYYEMFEANPGVDPDNPPVASELIVPTQYVLPSQLKENLILVNLAEMRLYFIPPGQKVVYIFPVGIGKMDWDTPTGMMQVLAKVPHPSWVVPKDIWQYRIAHGDVIPKVIPPGPENPLGDYALRLSGNGAYLIHGTNLAAGVGRRSSAGCIRLYPEDIKKLFGMVSVGTPVLIINSPYKAGWSKGKFYLEAHLPLLEQRLDSVAGDMTPVIDVINEANQNKKANIDWHRAFKVTNEHLCIPRPIER